MFSKKLFLIVCNHFKISMKRVILISLFTALSCFTTLHSQAILSITPDTTAFPSPQQALYDFNDTLNFRFFIQNIGSDTLFNQIGINQTVNGGQLRVDSLPLQIIPPGGVIQSNLFDSIQAGRYGGGINVVVIWPSAANTITSDSAEAEINVNALSNILNADFPPSNWSLFPNPTSGYLRIQTDIEDYLIAETSVIAMDGRLLQKIKGIPTQIDLGNLPDGMYWLKIGLKDGRAKYFRLVKRRE